MGLIGLLTWPIRTAIAFITHLLTLIISIVLFPYRLTSRLIKSLHDKVNNAVHFVEEKIKVVKRMKPICYFFPSCQVTAGPVPSQLNINSTDHHPHGEEEEEEESQSISSLIQDLIKLSQPETRQQMIGQQAPHVSFGFMIFKLVLRLTSKDCLVNTLWSCHLYKQLDIIIVARKEREYGAPSKETTQEKIQLLLQELQELAESNGVSDSGREGEQEREGQKEEVVSGMLRDLNVLENYLTQFVEEQEHVPSNAHLLPDRTSSLETIIEETTSKESSPHHPGSPLPPTHRLRPLVPSEGTIKEEESDLSKSQHEISQTLLMLQKVTNSKELKETLQQLAEMHKQDEFETPPTSLSSTPDPSSGNMSPTDKERRDALTTQLTDSQQQMDNIINSLVQQEKVMTCHQELLSSQQELQNVMDSLTLQTSNAPQATPIKPLSTTPAQDQLYDSLANINTTPTYAKINKPQKTTPSEDIYDSIQPLNQSTPDEVPPPIPRRRAGSDASTDSCGESPLISKKKMRHHSSSCDDERCSKHGRRVHRRHSSHHHRRDHSPKSSRHHQRSHDSRCHHHSTSDDSQDESDYHGTGSRRGRYESSGYDSHQDIDSPVITRRRGRAKSDAFLGVEPTTPTTGKRSFFGFFGKNKSTSLTSLSSNKSVDDRASVSSYKM